MAEAYRYPDHDDVVTKLGLEGSEPFPGYWIQSERRILDLMATRIASLRQGFGKPSWMMDAGCGWGRLIPRFHPYFDRVLAVEPDPERLDRARQSAAKEGFQEKTVFLCQQLQDLAWPDGSIDVAISSHVIQHVRTDLVLPILRNLLRVIRADGVLFLTTSHSPIGRDLHAVGVANEARATFRPIAREEFDRIAASSSEGLPVRFYAIRTLEMILSEAGFLTEQVRVFQLMGHSRVLRIADALIGRDRLANTCSILKERMGSNVFVAARKARPT